MFDISRKDSPLKAKSLMSSSRDFFTVDTQKQRLGSAKKAVENIEIKFGICNN